MRVKIKKLHENAVIPKYAKEGDAGLDLVVTSSTYIEDITEDHFGIVNEVGFGIAIEIPEGHVGLLFPRSSIYKKGLSLSNCVGVIDSGYRGEIKAKFYASDPFDFGYYDIGEKAVQLIIIEQPYIEVEEVEELTSTERGINGFGSTGL